MGAADRAADAASDAAEARRRRRGAAAGAAGAAHGAEGSERSVCEGRPVGWLGRAARRRQLVRDRRDRRWLNDGAWAYVDWWLERRQRGGVDLVRASSRIYLDRTRHAVRLAASHGLQHASAPPVWLARSCPRASPGPLAARPLVRFFASRPSRALLADFLHPAGTVCIGVARQ